MKNRPHVVESIQYSFIPNRRETMLALARAKFTSQEWRVIIALLNQTDGYRRDADEISSRFWQAITFMSREVIARTINGLLERGIMAKENREGAIFYRLNHPNDWPLGVFTLHHLSGKALKQAQDLYQKEKEKGKFLWLKRLLGSYRDQPVTLVDSDSSSGSVPEESDKPGIPQESVTNQSHKRDQPVTLVCPTSHALNAPKESLKKAPKESIIPKGADKTASEEILDSPSRYEDVLKVILEAKNPQAAMLRVMRAKFPQFDWKRLDQHQAIGRLGKLIKGFGKEEALRAVWEAERSRRRVLDNPISFIHAILLNQGKVPRRGEATATADDFGEGQW